MHHPTDRITHTTAFVTPVVEHWLEREIEEEKEQNFYPTYGYVSNVFTKCMSHSTNVIQENNHKSMVWIIFCIIMDI